MGLLSKCALPAHLDEPSEWKGTDDDQVWWMRWRLYVKHWFAFAATDRCSQGIDLSLVYFPGLYVLPLTIWFTGWTWWYLFPIGVIPVLKRWRRIPTTIFVAHGGGPLRMENADSSAIVQLVKKPFLIFPHFESSMMSVMTPFYLSRIQRWCRWHVAVQWPFLFQCHLYPHAEDVATVDDHSDKDGKVRHFFRGWHRDGDEIYWGDGACTPGNFK